ncbi:DUF397 domain-containing protein [Micromonospora gifhornensis]|uniref:DUF397 domain-containing protein n=1 Tax=Micromonospora gifhornensis TaxID=84594 RepID=UPI0019530EA3
MERNVWRTSSHSGSNGRCVGVRDRGSEVGVRDSKGPTTGRLSFGPVAWDAVVRDGRPSPLACGPCGHVCRTDRRKFSAIAVCRKVFRRRRDQQRGNC